MSKHLLPPARTDVYTATSLRNMPGKAWWGNNPAKGMTDATTFDAWKRGTDAQVLRIPRVIAAEILDEDREFLKFDELRIEIWKRIAMHHEFSKIYTEFGANLYMGLTKGHAPKAATSQKVRERKIPYRSNQVGEIIELKKGIMLEPKEIASELESYHIHHACPITSSGIVYGMSNLVIVSPLYHQALHYV